MKKILAFLVLGASLVGCAFILVKPSVIFRNAGGISVKGYAVERVLSDAANWNATISTSGESANEAYSKLIKSRDISKEFLLKAGAKEKSLKFSPPNVSPVYKVATNGTQTNDVQRYAASISISYSDSDISAVSQLATTASSLIERGVSIYSSAPQFYYTKLEDLKLSLIEKASANARERAERLTRGSNSKLGAIISASQGIFQITQPLSNETSDWGMYDTQSQEKDVRCVVTVEFGTEK